MFGSPAPTATSFTSEQLSFLMQNFVMYDEERHELNCNFDRLFESRVILIGEVHNSVLIQRIQNQFFEKFVHTECCLLLESYHPSHKITPEAVKRWPDLPTKVTALGSDIRYPQEYDKTVKMHLLDDEKSHLFFEKKEHYRKMVGKLATLINELLKSSQAQVVDKKLKVNVENVAQIAKLFGDLEKTLQPLEAQIKKCVKARKLVTASNLTQYSSRVRASNLALADTILEKVKEFQLVIAVFGYAHFVLGEDIYNTLDKASIRPIILLPNEKLTRAGKLEREWQYGTNPMVTLVVEGLDKPLYIPEEFKSEFCDEIQIILKKDPNPAVMTPIRVDKQTIPNLCRCQRLFVPADTPLHFLEVPVEDLLFFEELSLSDTSHQQEINQRLDSLIKTSLILGGYSLTSFRSSGKLVFSVKWEGVKPVFEIKSSDKTELEVVPGGNIIISLSRLLKQMECSKTYELKVLPNQGMYLTDITQEELSKIVFIGENNKSQVNSDLLVKWLYAKSPKYKKVTIIAEYGLGINRATINEKIPALLLKSQHGFSLRLIE